MMQKLILVDQNDNELGTCEKMEAHEKGLLHRAVSVFIFNSKGQLLIQQRDEDKYHSGSLWSNTACSHPLEGETNLNAAQRCLRNEVGLQAKLIPAFSFIYRSSVDNGLIEHEFDHVFIGFSNTIPNLNPKEVMSVEWRSLDSINNELDLGEMEFTPWFKLSYKEAFNFGLKKSA